MIRDISSNYCYDIHHNLAIDYINEKLSVGTCCQSGRVISEETAIDRLWNINELKKIRSENIEGKLSDTFCNSCTK